MSTRSLIPILVRHVARGAMGTVSPPIPKIGLKIFRLNTAFDVKTEKIYSANQSNSLRNLSHFSF